MIRVGRNPDPIEVAMTALRGTHPHIKWRLVRNTNADQMNLSVDDLFVPLPSIPTASDIMAAAKALLRMLDRTPPNAAHRRRFRGRQRALRAQRAAFVVRVI